MENDIAAIRAMMEALFDPVGFAQGLGTMLTFGAGFLIWYAIRNVWSDRDE